MNIEFYNSKIAVVLPEKKSGTPLPNGVDLYEGRPFNAISKIKSYELNNDTFYSGILFVKNSDTFYRLVFENYDFAELTKVEDQKKICYFKFVKNTGVDSECYVDDEIVVASSWSAPIYAYNTKPGDNTYGGLFRHRITMDVLKGTFNLDDHINTI